MRSLIDTQAVNTLVTMASALRVKPLVQIEIFIVVQTFCVSELCIGLNHLRHEPTEDNGREFDSAAVQSPVWRLPDKLVAQEIK